MMHRYRPLPGVDTLAIVVAVALFLLTFAGSLALVYSARGEYEHPLSFTDTNGRRHTLDGPHGSR